MIALYSPATELLEYITFNISLIYFIFITSYPDERVKLSFTASIRTRDMLNRVLSGQMTAERDCLTASHFPEVSMYKDEGEMI